MLEGVEGANPDKTNGIAIVRRALEAPMRQIAENAGFDGDLIVDNVKQDEGSMGFNAATGDYEDLVKSGIIDPALVATSALIHASSVAGLMLTTDVLITELKDETEPEVAAVS